MSDKSEAYAKRVADRKTCRACHPRLCNPATAVGGWLDSDRLGPYTLWQGNLDVPVVVVGQDFSDVAAFERLRGWPGATIRTNTALADLLSSAGLSVQRPETGCSEDVLFFTNAVLCLKQGGMQAALSPADVRRCGERVLRPSLELVAPRAVATLGLPALNAVLQSYSLPRAERWSVLLDGGVTFDRPGPMRLFPMAYPGSRGQQNRDIAAQRRDWARLGSWLRTA